ncbi:MAG: 2-oxo-4-hydroxy-4-carboxy-5-ureidoimidazoline decarboxylase [Cystobacter sp.]
MSRLAWLNTLPEPEAREEFSRCCGAHRWAEAMTRARPFPSESALYDRADALWTTTEPEDWREAMTHHPRIGDVSKLREKFKASGAWSEQEQQGMQGAGEDVVQALADGNQDYEARFGFIFLVCATGKSAAQMLGLLRARMKNPPDRELRVAAEEQGKITRIRLEKLLSSP